MRNSKMYPITKIPPKKTSDEIRREIEQFLSRGGHVKTLPTGATAIDYSKERATRQGLD
jgi:hypothetical protein